jgi:uncharacterized protein YciI
MGEKLQFVYLFKSRRIDFLQTMTQEERMAMGGHLEYTKRLFSENKIVLAGPCLDGAYGIVIFQADSEQEAREIFENDPVVKANIMDVELHPYKVSLLKS